MRHRWSRPEQKQLVDMALRMASRELTAAQAASKLAAALTESNPANPLTDSAANYALSVALGAIDGETYGTSQDLLDEIASRGRRVPPVRIVFESQEARSINLAIDACLQFPPEELDERKAVFEFANLEAPGGRFFKGVDLAIDGRYEGDGEVRPNLEVRRRVEARRKNGQLMRRWRRMQEIYEGGTVDDRNLSKALRAYYHLAALVRSNQTVFWGQTKVTTASPDQLTRAADADLAKKPPPMTNRHIQDALDLLKEFEAALKRGERLYVGPLSGSGETADVELEGILKVS